jgi:hypothetical protein
MAIENATITVGTTPTLLAENTGDQNASADWAKVTFTLKIQTHTATVFLGDKNVATSGAHAGYPWEVGDGNRLEGLELEPGEQLFGVVATGTQVISRFKTGR